MNHWESLCKSKRPNNKSYETLVKFRNNSLVPVRLQFFIDVSSQLRGFLELFQTDKPMVPFLEDALSGVMRTLMKMVVKTDVLDGVLEGTSYKLIKLDLSVAENLIHYELLKLPTATKSLLKTKAIPFDKKRSFMKDCKQVLVTLLEKLQERCPLNYLICRNASSIVPYHMVTKKKRCIALFGRLVDKLFESKWLSSEKSDLAKKEYDTLIQSANQELKDKFLGFKSEGRIDSFFGELMHGISKYKNCFEVFKLIFVLSHGQAAVERGISVNKELLTENLEEVSLISQRLVYDHINDSGLSITKIPLPNELLKSCKLAHSRYNSALENQKLKVSKDENKRKRKLKMEEIADVKEKKRAVESFIKSLEGDIETYSLAAEKDNDMTLLTKANSFRVSVRAKKETLSTLEKTLGNLEKEL